MPTFTSVKQKVLRPCVALETNYFHRMYVIRQNRVLRYLHDSISPPIVNKNLQQQQNKKDRPKSALDCICG